MKRMISLVVLFATIQCGLSIPLSDDVQNVSQINRTIKSADSNIGCQIVVFNGWPLFEVYTLANTDQTYWALVMDDLIQRFTAKTVILTSLHPFPGTNDFEETDESITIRHASTAVQVLRDFGRDIRKLRIEFTSSQSTQGVFELIQEQCTDTLEELHLKWLGQNFFLDSTMPLKGVKILTLASDIMEISSSNKHNFGELFPNLNQLNLSYVKVSDATKILVKYPTLEQLNVDVYAFEEPGHIAETHIIELLQQNTQIRRLSLRNVSPKLLKVAADSLKNLERLEIYRYDERNHDANNFHFEQLKVFKIGAGFQQSVPTNITFKLLEEFEVEAYPQDSKYITIIENNNNILRKFQMNGKFSLKNEEIRRLASANANLQEMIINFDWGVSDDHIVQLVRSSNKSNRILLKMNEKTSKINMLATIWNLQKQFEEEWSINVVEYDILLERKISDVE